MSNSDTLIFVIFFSLSIYFFYKYFFIYKRIHNSYKYKCILTDTTYKTMYNNNLYIYYYTYIINDKEYNTSDKSKYKLIFFKPKIKDELDIYIDNSNPSKVVTPLEIVKSKIYLLFAILFIVLPFILV